MRNLADYIEAFILGKLAVEREENVILKRNEVAEAMECAPSQVTYVLSTRFTEARGFQVESRRGAGGFVRITRVPIEKLVCEEAAQQVDERTTQRELAHMLRQLQTQRLLSGRETKLVAAFFDLLFAETEPQLRARMIRSLLLTMAELD